MKFVEAVNRVEEKYGKQAFDHLEDYAEDEAAQLLLEERKRSSTKTNKNSKRGKDPGPLALRKMIEDGYAYMDIVAATGLGITTVQVKVKKYGLRELLPQNASRSQKARRQGIMYQSHDRRAKRIRNYGKRRTCFRLVPLCFVAKYEKRKSLCAW